MEHKKYDELLYLFSVGEAGDEEKRIIEAHILECPHCKHELENYTQLNKSLSVSAAGNLPDDLLLNSRTLLRERLIAERSRSSSNKNIPEIFLLVFKKNYKYAFSLAAGLLLGFLLFRGESNPVVLPTDQQSGLIATSSFFPEEKPRIHNIKLYADPYDDNIEFSFDAVREVKVAGSINDENIRNILMYAIMNGNNPGVRLNSLNLINSSEQLDFDNEIKEAIISAVKYDDNPGVRREALKILKTFPFDQDVKRSYLYIILNDSSSAMRIDAINHLLEASSKESPLSKEEMTLLKDKLLDDENSYIRLRAKTVVEEHNL
jgi:hypothetical protein